MNPSRAPLSAARLKLRAGRGSDVALYISLWQPLKRNLNVTAIESEPNISLGFDLYVTGILL